MIFITGDTHHNMDVSKFNNILFPEGHNLTKHDYVIICGDFGLLWTDVFKSTEAALRNLYKSYKWTTLFVDGNHDNHDRLDQLPTIDMFGSKVGYVSDDIYHLKRGEVYTIDQKNIFTMGGALSTDKHSNPHRIAGVGWWERELPSWKEYDYGLGNLLKHNNKVDYIITHTAPTSIISMYLMQFEPTGWSITTPKDESYYYRIKDPVSVYLETIKDTVRFQTWFFGHMHDEWRCGSFQMLFNDIVPLI